MSSEAKHESRREETEETLAHVRHLVDCFVNLVEMTAGNLAVSDAKRTLDLPLLNVPRVARRTEITVTLEHVRGLAEKYASPSGYLATFKSVRGGWLDAVSNLRARIDAECADLGGGLEREGELAMPDYKVTLVDHEGTAHCESGTVRAESAKDAALLFAQARGYPTLEHQTECSDTITTWMAVPQDGEPKRAALVVAMRGA